MSPAQKGDAMISETPYRERIIKAGTNWCAHTHGHSGEQAALAAARETLQIVKELMVGAVLAESVQLDIDQLDALLRQGRIRQQEEKKDDQGAGPIGQPIPTGAETEPRPITGNDLIFVMRAIRSLDCGALHCRYCRAGQANQWQHEEYCVYQQSVKDAETARGIIASLRVQMIGSHGTPSVSEALRTGTER